MPSAALAYRTPASRADHLACIRAAIGRHPAGDEDFAELLKKTVEDMHGDGTLRRLSLKWFEFDMTQR
ncbi:hypothetical protein ACFPL7_23365 [Dongia soli]|uniref:Uncharacterized protein n=1 Tax=Dongia soli TaxID=600628 RepID=A0ABU5EHI7_9PROT|nr:hypothetical protein [Dongia soli]MDY0885686.1 hypothetical protein [Dongia soli]